jgi:hypothetical protein
LDDPLSLQWTRPEWIEQAHAWINQSLAEHGYELTGPIEQFHARIWSTVMRCPTSAGLLYFKACQRLTEPQLTLYLSRVQADNIPDLVAFDLDRGWMLMRDAGPMLRAYLKSPQDLDMLEPALIQFANLQIAVAPQAKHFFGLGARDRRLERLPGLFETMLAEAEILRIGAADGLTQPQYQQLRATLPRYMEMCRQLESCSIPQTLFHDDFHDGNIFVSGTPGQYRFVFSDWDESCVGHPFVSMMLCLRSVGSRAGFQDEATEAPERMPPELNRLRDIYLQPWQRYESPERLIEIFNLAWRVGMVSRALTWREFVSSLDRLRGAEFTYIVPAWLQEYLLAMK